MDGGDAVLVGELAHKTKPADTASETSSLPEQQGFRGFVLLDTQDFTGEPNFWVKSGFRYIRSRGYPLDCSVQSPSPLGAAPGMPNSNLVDCRRA